MQGLKSFFKPIIRKDPVVEEKPVVNDPQTNSVGVNGSTLPLNDISIPCRSELVNKATEIQDVNIDGAVNILECSKPNPDVEVIVPVKPPVKLHPFFGGQAVSLQKPVPSDVPNHNIAIVDMNICNNKVEVISLDTPTSTPEESVVISGASIEEKLQPTGTRSSARVEKLNAMKEKEREKEKENTLVNPTNNNNTRRRAEVPAAIFMTKVSQCRSCHHAMLIVLCIE